MLIYMEPTIAKGMIISAGQCSGLPEFNKLLNIVINFENVFFVTTKFSSWLMEHYRSDKVVDTHCLDVEILDLEDLNDYQPQTVYCFVYKMFFFCVCVFTVFVAKCKHQPQTH